MTLESGTPCVPSGSGGSLRAFRRAGKTSRGIGVGVIIVGVPLRSPSTLLAMLNWSNRFPMKKLQVLLSNGLGLEFLSHFGSTWLQLGSQNCFQTLPNPTQIASKSSSTSYCQHQLASKRVPLNSGTVFWANLASTCSPKPFKMEGESWKMWC